MFRTNTEFDAFQLGQTYSGRITPRGPSRADWFSPRQVEEIELAYQRDAAGITAQAKALLAALTEAVPDHPLVKKERRLGIYNEAYDAHVPQKK